MQKGILIKSGMDIKAKHVYGGNICDGFMASIILGFESDYPSCTVELYTSDQDPAFVSAIVNSPFAPEI